MGVRVVELRDLAVGIAHHLTLGYPSPALGEAISTVARADGLIAVTPVYHASYSGLFKSFFDLIDPAALAGTPVLIGSTGGTARHSLTLDHALRPLFAYLHALVVPTAVFAATADWGTAAESHPNPSRQGSTPRRANWSTSSRSALSAPAQARRLTPTTTRPSPAPRRWFRSPISSPASAVRPDP